MIAIDKYLRKILSDFQYYINTGDNLCYLKSVNYDAGHRLNYGDLHVQQYYLLRYAFGYAFEYLQMYRHLFHRLHGQTTLEVLSLGCGTMIDYWSLVKANRLSRESNGPCFSEFSYTGVDCVRWFYQMKARTLENETLDQVKFVRKDVIRYLEDIPSVTADVIIFPKSISEFTVRQAQLIGRIIAGKVPENRTVYFLFSLRSQDDNKKQDMENTKQIYSAMVDAGFRTFDPVQTFWFVPGGENNKIYSSYGGLFQNSRVVMAEIMGCLSELHTKCSVYQENGHECTADCRDRLTRSPILYQKYALWQLFEFRKGN